MYHPLCIHTTSTHHETHVPPWSVSHWWLNMGVTALLPWMTAWIHTHTRAQKHAWSRGQQLLTQTLYANEAVQLWYTIYPPHSHPTSFPLWRICITCFTRWLWVKPHGLVYQADQNSLWCHTSPEHFATNAQAWKQAFLSALPASLSFYLGGTQIQFNLSRVREQASNQVIDFRESSVTQFVCVCIQALPTFHVLSEWSWTTRSGLKRSNRMFAEVGTVTPALDDSANKQPS